ncbi:MAG: hypothetical protein EZS28_005631 [Streblomastix strix]|uniref:Uncharacterized protein n=1 Tax=Streblomastix strix TaxID=222440 RepID=A0A5J4WX35_9EUKA|nr:MAG: hypothetical protein EZS28_005631 [Streblomastix strix]
MEKTKLNGEVLGNRQRKAKRFQLNSEDFKHLDINQTGKAIQIGSKIRFGSPTSAVTIDGNCRKLHIKSFKRMGSSWGNRSSKLAVLEQLISKELEQKVINEVKEEDVKWFNPIIAVQNRKKWEIEESSRLSFTIQVSINGAYQNIGRINIERSSLPRGLGNKDRHNECLSSPTSQQESAIIPRIQVQGEELRLYSNVFQAHKCPSDFIQNNETHNQIHSMNSTYQKRVVLRRSGVSSSIKKKALIQLTLNLGNISKVWMQCISREVCLNSDTAIRVCRMVPQHNHESDINDNDQKSRAAVTNIEMKKNDSEEKDNQDKVVGLIDRKIKFAYGFDKDRRLVYVKNKQVEEFSNECKNWNSYMWINRSVLTDLRW